MNILQILPELVVGGVETGTVDFSSKLVERGHKSVVVSNGGPLVRQLEAAGAKHYKLPVHKKSLFSILRCIKELESIIRQEHIHVVHARSRVPAIIAFFSARRITAKNIETHLPVFITTCHGYYSRHFFSRPMSWGRFVICSSNIIASHMTGDFSVPFSRIKFIPRGVDIEKFNFTLPSAKNKQYRTIGIIGRITPIKGHTFFIKAVSKVIKAMPGTKVVVIGRPPEAKEDYLKELKVTAERLGIIESVEFLGHRHDIPHLLSGMDLLVLSSTGPEAFGRVIIEAQAAGVPVVATKVGGVTDIIEDNKNGLIVEPHNTEQLSGAMLRILTDRGLADKLARQAREDVEKKFTLSAMTQKTLDTYQEAVSKPRILVIKIGALGDVILVVPALRALRQRFPGAHIAVLVGVESRQILQGCPYVDEIIIYNKVFVKQRFSNFIKLAVNIRRCAFDMVVDFQNTNRSHLLSYISMAPKRFGYRNKKLGFLLNYGIKDFNVEVQPVCHQFRVLNTLGIQLKDQRLELWPSQDDFIGIDKFLSWQWALKDQHLVGINIGGSARWKTKRLPRETLVKLCDQLSGLKARAVLIGTKKDVETAVFVSARAKSKPINAAGKTTLGELVALVKKCKVLISTDSAPVHIASAVGTPVVAIFGPTDAARHKPPGENVVIIKTELKCSPCYKLDCRHLKCIKELDTKDIVKEASRFL